MRYLTILLSLVLPVTASAALFSDTFNHRYEWSIDQLAQQGVVQGYGGGVYRPDVAVNRAELLKTTMLSAFGDDFTGRDSSGCFTDFVGTPQWFWPTACLAKLMGIIGGYPDGSFQGARTVNLAEALKIIIETWELTDEGVPGPAWYDVYFSVAERYGVFQGITRNPSHLLTRGEMAYLIVAFSNGGRLDEFAIDTNAYIPEGPAIVSVTPRSPRICGNGIVEPGEQCDDGNLTNGDGCSEICVIVAEPVRHGALRVEQRPFAVSGFTPGARDVTIFALDAVAGRQDVSLTNLDFVAAVGSLSIANNYRVWADTNFDGQVDTVFQTVSPSGNQLSFDNLRIPVLDGRATRIEVHADILQNVSAGSFSLAFATSDPRFVQAIGLEDGRDLDGIILNGGSCTQSSICWIAVYTSTTPSFSVQSRGNLFVTADSTPVRSHQLLGGQTSETVLALKMRAAGEDVEVEELRFTGIPESVDHLLIIPHGSTQALATARSSACATPVAGQFCGDGDFVIRAEDEVRLQVKAVVKADTQGAVSGDTATLVVQAAGPADAVEALGLSTSENLLQNDGDTTEEGEIFIGRSSAGANQNITGSTHDIVLAKITGIANANGDSDGTAVPTGNYPFGKFQFTAGAHVNSNGGLNRAVIDTLVFQVNATNVEFTNGSFALFNAANAPVTSACTNSATTGVITVTCAGLQASSVSTGIEPGDAIVLGLQGDIANPQVVAGTSQLQASLNNLGNRASPGTVVWSDEVSTFGWVDMGDTTVRSTTYSSN